MLPEPGEVSGNLGLSTRVSLAISTNKLGDKEEVAKLKENAELNEKVAEYERKKKEKEERGINIKVDTPLIGLNG